MTAFTTAQTTQLLQRCGCSEHKARPLHRGKCGLLHGRGAIGEGKAYRCVISCPCNLWCCASANRLVSSLICFSALFSQVKLDPSIFRQHNHCRFQTLETIFWATLGNNHQFTLYSCCMPALCFEFQTHGVKSLRLNFVGVSSANALASMSPGVEGLILREEHEKTQAATSPSPVAWAVCRLQSSLRAAWLTNNWNWKRPAFGTIWSNGHWQKGQSYFTI